MFRGFGGFRGLGFRVTGFGLRFQSKGFVVSGFGKQVLRLNRSV